MSQTKLAVRSLPSRTAPTGVASPTAPSSVSIEHVSCALVPAVWPQLQRAFRKAQKKACGDRMDEVAIVNALCEGSLELLIARKGQDVLGGIILQFVKRPKGRLCCSVVVSLFDSYPPPSWVRVMNDHLMGYALRLRRCYCIEALARAGAVAPLREMGWRCKAVVMEVR